MNTRLNPTDNIYWTKAKLDYIGRVYNKNVPGGVLTFSAPSIIGLVLVIIFPWPPIPHHTELTYFSFSCMFAFVIVGSYGAYSWDKRIFYAFFQKLHQLRKNQIIIMKNEVFDEYFQTFNAMKNRHPKTGLLVSAGIAGVVEMFVITIYSPYLTQLSLTFWAILWGVVYYLAVYIAVMGINNVMITLTLIKRLSRVENFTMKLNPLHPDRFGGLKSLQDFCVGTSYHLSCLALLIPWMIEELQLLYIFNHAIPFITLVAALVFAVVIMLLSFIVPTLDLYRLAQREKNALLLEAGDAYHKIYPLYQESISTQANHLKILELSQFLQIQLARFQEFEKMKAFPISLPSLSKLLTSVIIPSTVFILQQLISS